MTKWLIIVLILAFLIGSWSWVKPTADERRRVRLRNRAISKGLKVESVKGQVRERFAKSGEGGLLMLYWAPWSAEAAVDRRALLIPRRIEPGEENSAFPGAGALPELSGAFKGWLADQRGIGFVWDESATIDDLEKPMSWALKIAEGVGH
ncbi:hypothetical protein EZI54_01690 [Marinobacter halodurans]|uniref:Uncharacterized protein n=1 Tax=Marinobacter halodurans TaxID=2528979 RepID=A0ABY1ZRY8_9GAMM|nr:hypothetical protein [Marinobacter halodurans]TBW59052.1 hypothetical protein EZI54_01690 [Marinobacter halodurans]